LGSEKSRHKKYNTLLPGSASLLHSRLLHPSALSSTGKWEMEGCGQSITAPPCYSFLLMLLPYSSMCFL